VLDGRRVAGPLDVAASSRLKRPQSTIQTAACHPSDTPPATTQPSHRQTASQTSPDRHVAPAARDTRSSSYRIYHFRAGTRANPSTHGDNLIENRSRARSSRYRSASRASDKIFRQNFYAADGVSKVSTTTITAITVRRAAIGDKLSKLQKFDDRPEGGRARDMIARSA